jgi:hypothetical protein
MSKRNIIRKNDHVTIVNPEIVVRWGYPLCKQIVKDTLISQKQKEALYALLRAFDLPRPPNQGKELTGDLFGGWLDGLIASTPDTTAHDKILDVLSYEVLKKKMFGGKERKLYTEHRESLREARGEVVDKKVVQSGTYKPGGSYVSGYYGDEYDYEPPYLAIAKAHVLCKVYVHWNEGICPNVNNEGGIWIENVNLKKVEDYRPTPPGHIDIERLRERLAEFERR